MEFSDSERSILLIASKSFAKHNISKVSSLPTSTKRTFGVCCDSSHNNKFLNKFVERQYIKLFFLHFIVIIIIYYNRKINLYLEMLCLHLGKLNYMYHRLMIRLLYSISVALDISRFYMKVRQEVCLSNFLKTRACQRKS